MTLTVTRAKGSSYRVNYGGGTLYFVASQGISGIQLDGWDYNLLSARYKSSGRKLNATVYLGQIKARKDVSIRYVNDTAIDLVIEDTTQRYVYGSDGSIRREARVRFRKIY